MIESAYFYFGVSWVITRFMSPRLLSKMLAPGVVKDHHAKSDQRCAVRQLGADDVAAARQGHIDAVKKNIFEDFSR